MAMTRQTLRAWYLVHKWTSLLCTLFLLILCLTGLPLIFHQEIDAALGGPVARGGPPANARPDLDRIVAQARARHPGSVVTFLDWGLDKPVITVITAPSPGAEEGRHADTFDARTGAPLEARPGYGDVADFLLDLHTTLFLGLGGELLLGAMGLLLVLALVSGAVVYVPFMRKLDFATVRRNRSSRVLWLDLHNLVGIVTLGWLAVVGITGVINTLTVPARTLWQRTELVSMVAPYRSLPAPAHFVSLDRIVMNALAASPGMSVSTVAFPGTSMASPRHFTVFLRGSAPVTRRLIAPVLVDGQSGSVVAIRDMPAYVKVLFLSQPLHFGDYAGLPLKILWALLDVAALVVLGSGVYLWMGRRRTPLAHRVEELLVDGASS